MLFFAYDGSIHSDWVSHYAVRLATNHPDRILHPIHVREKHLSEEPLDEKLERIRAKCQHLGIELRLHIERMAGAINQTIRSTVAGRADSHLVFDTRAHERKQGLLSGTVSEHLSRLGDCNVLALRVVQPGLIGCPRRLLLPVSVYPRGFRSGLPFLQLFGPGIVQMHILFVRRVASWRFRMLSHIAADQLRQLGQAYCERVEQEISELLNLGASIVDTNTVVSDDVPKEIVIAATKTKSRLIYMGGSERNLTERLLYGNPIEQMLRDAICDVAIYRGIP